MDKDFLKKTDDRYKRMQSAVNASASQTQTLQDEISDLLQKQAIRLADPHLPDFYSQMFVVPKKDGGWRPIINLKSLNSYLCIPHFKLENIQNLKDVLLQNDYMAKVDLKDAYLTVPMHHTAYKYLRFTWKGKCYKFTSPIQSCSSPTHFRQATQTNSVIFEESGSPTVSIHRRHPTHGIIGKPFERASCTYDESFEESRFPTEFQEMHRR